MICGADSWVEIEEFGKDKIEWLETFLELPHGIASHDTIADFYAPSGKLVIEVDGGQHYEENYRQKDQERDFFMEQQGLKTFRFNNLQALQSIDDVIDVIFNALNSYLLKRA